MLQQRYLKSAGDPADAFFGSLFSAYSKTVIYPFYQSMVRFEINSFFGNNPPQAGNWPVTGIFNYPSLNTDSGESIPFGYVTGLAADLYGQPSDLVNAFSHLPGNRNNFKKFIYYFQQEIQQEIIGNLKYPDDIKISWSSAPDDFASFIKLAKLNYSHFAGHNLLFYISYHLLAVDDAIQSAAAAKSGDRAGVHTHFNTALIEEAFALHFLTDMFSSGHARVPRWAFLYGLNFWGINQADLISKLVHDFEGTEGVLVMNASANPKTKNYFWKTYGDGSLHFETLDQQDNLVYLKTAETTIDNAKMSSEPIKWGEYMPKTRGDDDNLRRFDLITGLMCASMVDVFRHMADDMTSATSAGGTTDQPTGLLGYILQRVPFALPIAAALPSVPISDSIRDELMKTFYSPKTGPVPAYGTTALNVRLMKNNYHDLFGTFQKVPDTIKSRALSNYSIEEDFRRHYCVPKFDPPAASPSSDLERHWVISQIANLQKAFGTSRNSMLATVIPSILKGTTADFAPTIVTSFIRPSSSDLPSLPTNWIDAVPADLIKALVSNPDGIWGIEP